MSALPRGDGDVLREAARRRTFAIISHPDAGKTTLTEKLLLYGGALREAGQVQARNGRRAAVSDWMEMERARGISVTSTVMRFEYRGCVLNLLDTPGHRDFSEDTLRVLAAADCAVVLLDAARGVQEQTRMLFEVARARRLPLITFVNKYDRPGMEPLAMLDHIEAELGLSAAALTWPVGDPGDFHGIVDRRDGRYLRLDRTPRGSLAAAETAVDPARAAREEGSVWVAAAEELELLAHAGASFQTEGFLAGEITPVLFGSAMWNFGVRQLLEAVIDEAPSPFAQTDTAGRRVPLNGEFTAQVFKVQANLDPRHRDRLAFLRVWAGRFERGMRVKNLRTGRTLALQHAHLVFGRERDHLDESFPGDVLGVSGAQDLCVGDTLAIASTACLPEIPTLVPEQFVTARPAEAAGRKRFRRGLQALDQEGVVHVLHRRASQDPVPVLGAVGALQFEVCAYRMTREFGCPIRLDAAEWTVSRRVTEQAADVVVRSGLGEVLERDDGTLLAAFVSAQRMQRFVAEHPEVELSRVLIDLPR